MRSSQVRAEIQRLIKQAPFRPFAISLENGQQAVIEHPENIAFQPGKKGSEDFYVLTGKLRLYSWFSAVTSVALADKHVTAGDGDE